MKYIICQTIITQESAENGDYESTDSWESDDILELFKTRTNAVGGIESIHAEYNCGRLSIYVNNGIEYETDEREERSTCIKTSKASAMRLCSILNIKL